MNCRTHKKNILGILAMIVILLLFVGCGQQKAVEKDQQDSIENNAVNNIETEESSSPASEEAVQDENAASAPVVVGQSPKTAPQQTAPVQNNNSNTNTPVKANNAAEVSKDKPSSSTEEGDKTVIPPEGANTRTPEQMREGMNNTLQGLVDNGTITKEQAEKIVDAIFSAGRQEGSGMRFTQSPFAALVEQGVITQEQADAVMNAMSNSKKQ
ncbi:hypothetical protein [Geosporobacter ferrireducens]|uniref:Uncharacterized protein n=1 Tax=Geosporobacter ferrireducens TaxID=1424294 RepID=A0A1D8GM61_9FIRM|nr:hypothetical protein [Geosporobacter ferrireducens]AOT72004.1 hypothetical protein Gferi_22150 [Geosporobacter ferrireducens]